MSAEGAQTNAGSPVTSWVATGFRVALGAAIAFSGVVKLMDVEAFAVSIKAFRIVSDETLINQAAFSIPWTELLIGAMLVLGVSARVAASSLLVMLVIFTAALVSVITRGIDTTCGCFGALFGDTIDWSTVARNGVLMAVAAFVAVKSGGALKLDSLWREKAAADPTAAPDPA